MKYIPNSLSIIRIFLSISLIFAIDNIIIFSIVYFLCGLSDVFDGVIARRFKCESNIGAKLDSFADFLFFSVVFFLFFTSTSVFSNLFLIVIVLIIVIIRFINIIITKIKFKTIGIMHTMMNKVTGILLFAFLPLVYFNEELLIELSTIIFLIGTMSSLEEMAIILTTQKYNPNTKSILIK